MKRLPCALVLAGALAGATFAVSGCSTMSPIQTSVPYNPSDGVPASSGPVLARNLLVVGEQEGGPGTLSGSLLNRSDSPVQVSFQTREESQSNAAPNTGITLAGRQQRQITEVTFASLDAPPGALTDIYLVTSAGKTLVTVPVLAPEGYYATLRPTRAAATTASPTTASPTTAGPTTTPTSGTGATGTTAPRTTAPTTQATPTE